MSIYFLTNPDAGKRWTDAEAQAVAAGGHLVTINDIDEQRLLSRTYTNKVPYQGSLVRESYWIGLRDTVGNNKSDTWVSGEPVTYTNWADGEPSNGFEQYVELNPLFAPGRWNDRVNDASPIGGRGIVEIATPGANIYGTGRDELIVGNSLNNYIVAAAGNDIVYGKAGNDRIYGGVGNDLLHAGTGNDLLIGGAGNDTLTGDIGADSFAFNSPNEGVDTITDFSVVDDTIRIYGFGSNLIPQRFITADQFRVGLTALDHSDRFIYNRSTGALFFDRDGIGGAPKVQLAQLAAGLPMTNRDIYIANIPA